MTTIDQDPQATGRRATQLLLYYIVEAGGSDASARAEFGIRDSLRGTRRELF